MQRLIDAAPVEAKLDKIIRSMSGKSGPILGYSMALAELYAAPTVDAVAVTRCKNCKHWGPRLPEDESKGICWAFGAQPAAVTGADDYCSRAERRKDDDEGQRLSDRRQQAERKGGPAAISH